MSEDLAKKRILVSTFEYGPVHVGGLGTMLTGLCNGLEGTRYRPVVVMPGSGYRPSWPLLRRLQSSYCEAEIYDAGPAEVWLLRNDILDGDFVYAEDPLREGIKKTDEYGERLADLLPLMAVDLVHLHDAFGYKCLHRCSQLGLPTLFTVHRLHDDEPPFAMAEMAAVALADEVSTVSRAFAFEARDFFARRERVYAVANGIDHRLWCADDGRSMDDEAARRQRRRRLLARHDLPERITFAYIGRLDPDQKGIDVLIEAWTGHLGNLAANLLICGDGDDVLADEIAELAAADPDRIRFLRGYHRQEQVRELLGSVDHVLIPSRYEPFGLIQLEAMAVGALVIASRTGGLGEVLVDIAEPGGFARLVPPGEPRALARAVRAAALVHESDPGPAARRRLGVERSKLYSFEAMAAGYAEIYDQMLVGTGWQEVPARAAREAAL